MARGQRTNRILIPGAYQALDRLKYEVAAQVGIPNYQGYLGDVPARINGQVGGNMVRRMIALAEQQLAQGAQTPHIGIDPGTQAFAGSPAAGTPQQAGFGFPAGIAPLQTAGFGGPPHPGAFGPQAAGFQPQVAALQTQPGAFGGYQAARAF